MSFEEYIIEVVDEDYVYITDGESIDEPEDYETLIEDLFSLTDGELSLESFEFEEDEEILIKIVVGGKLFSFGVEESGWIDSINLVKGLNEILILKKSKNRFYFFSDAESFGREIGFFFANQSGGRHIIDYAKEANESAMEVLELLQISDGTDEEGFQDI